MPTYVRTIHKDIMGHIRGTNKYTALATIDAQPPWMHNSVSGCGDERVQI